jgi:hypothetical protein
MKHVLIVVCAILTGSGAVGLSFKAPSSNHGSLAVANRERHISAEDSWPPHPWLNPGERSEHLKEGWVGLPKTDVIELKGKARKKGVERLKKVAAVEIAKDLDQYTTLKPRKGKVPYLIRAIRFEGFPEGGFSVSYNGSLLSAGFSALGRRVAKITEAPLVIFLPKGAPQPVRVLVYGSLAE